jgi:hypothetical protein
VSTELIYEGWVCEHLHYLSAYDNLMEEVKLVLHGGPRIVALVLGLSGSGKTEMLKDITEEFAGRVSATGHPAVLYVSFPPGTTADAVASRIIKKVLGVPVVTGTAAERREMAIRVLASSGVQVLILDEANHAAESRSTRATQTKANRLTADWIKEIVEVGKVSVVLSGLPHSRRLLTDNDQLEGRAMRPIEMRPYAWHVEKDRHAFKELVDNFTGLACASGWQVAVPSDLLTRATYLTSRGLVRPVRRLFERAVLAGRKGEALGAAVFARAYDKCFAERLCGNPFELEKISDEMLNAAHRQLLQSTHEPAHHQRGRKGAHHG